MSKRFIAINSATIWGLNQPYYFFHRQNCWCWNLTIKHQLSPKLFNSNCKIILGFDGSETTKNFRTITDFFKKKGITNGSNVRIISDKSGILAIGKDMHDHWLSVRGEFKEKTFTELVFLSDCVIICTS